MSEDTEKFLEAEQAAQEVLEALQRLREEAISYKTATADLDLVRERLLGLITSTEAIGKDTHNVVKTLMDIGGPEILRRVNLVKALSFVAILISVLSLGGVLYLIFK
jgi:hypothetical protein